MAGNKNSGRKPKSSTETTNVAITAWMEPEAKEMIKKAAKVARVPTGRWLGNIGVREARNILAAGFDGK